MARATRCQAVREAMDEGFFGGLTEDEYQTLIKMEQFLVESIMNNAMEWLVADSLITMNGRERRAAELLLAPGGPVLSA